MNRIQAIIKKGILVGTIVCLTFAAIATQTMAVFTENSVKQSRTTRQNIADAYLSDLESAYVYRGKAIKPDFQVITERSEERDNGDGTITVRTEYLILQKESDYSVTYKNNTKIGKATVTIRGRGNYTGEQSATYKILPRSVTIKALQSAKRAVTVRWGKAAGGCSYQIAYRQCGRKSWNYTTSKTTSKKIRCLQSGKRYSVKVRAYKKVGGKRYNGTWSGEKKIMVS